MYQQLLYLIKLRLFPHPKESTKKTATNWCKESAISNKEALSKLFPEHQFKRLSEIHPQTMKNSLSIERSLPVEMGFGGDIDLLYNLVKASGASSVVETGVARGWSSMSILLGLDRTTNARLISTDMPYPKMGNEEFVGCVVPQEVKSNWTLIRKPDRQGLKQAFKTLEKISLCHYDSDKTYVGRMWAYPLLWHHLDKNGIFISDDINDNTAFEDFSESLGLTPVVVEFDEKFIGILIKRT